MAGSTEQIRDALLLIAGRIAWSTEGQLNAVNEAIVEYFVDLPIVQPEPLKLSDSLTPDVVDERPLELRNKVGDSR